MKIKNILFLAGTLILLDFSCKNVNKSSPHLTALEKEWKNHLNPQDSIVNTLKLGKTFALESSQVNGIERNEYNEPEYWKELDTNYFKRVESKDFSNKEEEGGSTYTLEIFKAIKKGTTEIKFYKREKNSNPESTEDPIQESLNENSRDTTIMYNTYKFRIE